MFYDGKVFFMCLEIIVQGRVKKSIMENSILRGGGVSEGHFPYPIFFILLLQMVTAKSKVFWIFNGENKLFTKSSQKMVQFQKKITLFFSIIGRGRGGQDLSWNFPYFFLNFFLTLPLCTLFLDFHPFLGQERFFGSPKSINTRLARIIKPKR